MNGALAFNISYNLRNRILRRDRNHHVDVVGHQMACLNFAFLLRRQLMKDFAQMLPELQIKRFPPAFGNEHNTCICSPIACGLNSCSPSLKFLVMCVVAHDWISSMDCQKRQTLIVSLAKPGGYSYLPQKIKRVLFEGPKQERLSHVMAAKMIAITAPNQANTTATATAQA